MSKSQKIIEEIAKLNTRFDNFETLLKSLIEKVDELSKSKTKITIPKKREKAKKIIKLGNVTLSRYNDIILVTGDTYARKAILKKYKARWKPDKKGWTLNLTHFENIKEDLQTYCESVEIEEKSENLIEKSEDVSSNHSSGNDVPVNQICEIMSDDDE